HTIEIDKFVPEEEIDKRYYERPYYIVPDGKSGEEAFAVIRDAMKDKGRVALAGIIFANRQPSSRGARACWGPRCATITRCGTKASSSRASEATACRRRWSASLRTSWIPRPATLIPASSRMSSSWRCANWSSARQLARRSKRRKKKRTARTSLTSWKR